MHGELSGTLKKEPTVDEFDRLFDLSTELNPSYFDGPEKIVDEYGTYAGELENHIVNAIMAINNTITAIISFFIFIHNGKIKFLLNRIKNYMNKLREGGD